MVFSSPIFLFGFLPFALCCYYVCPRGLKNALLVLLSLSFYAWGEVFYTAIMLASIAVNYVLGNLIGAGLVTHDRSAKPALVVGVAINCLILIVFKYANFIVDNLNGLISSASFTPIELAPVHLPLGISFFTFQAISYLVDVYRREVPAQKNLIDLALYISLFPQLIAGPIVRYQHVAKQIIERVHGAALFYSGVVRFVFGLSKKMLIANPLGEIADSAFALSGSDLTAPIAWIGVTAYALQIYFDFSGYSDMAIGLGRMFGFKFQENFNYPYIAKSAREFWQRWHISLSHWFRDYVYIPLGGSRNAHAYLTYRNLLIVFLLTGVWHGASWNFVVWGLFHGFFLALEHAGFKHVLKRAWAPLQHVYLLLIVLVSWVFFRADDLPTALSYCAAMFDFRNWETSTFVYSQLVSVDGILIMALGALLATPVASRFVATQMDRQYSAAHQLSLLLVLVGVFYLSVLKVASSTYNPFIYFRF